MSPEAESFRAQFDRWLGTESEIVDRFILLVREQDAEITRLKDFVETARLMICIRHSLNPRAAECSPNAIYERCKTARIILGGNP